jgi:Flp pilus assembly protein TadB
MTIGFGSEQGKDAVRRTLKGTRPRRISIFVIVAAFLALGIYTEILLIIVLAGIAVVLAGASLAWAWRDNHAARRLERSSSLADS